MTFRGSGEERKRERERERERDLELGYIALAYGHVRWLFFSGFLIRIVFHLTLYLSFLLLFFTHFTHFSSKLFETVMNSYS